VARLAANAPEERLIPPGCISAAWKMVCLGLALSGLLTGIGLSERLKTTGCFGHLFVTGELS